MSGGGEMGISGKELGDAEKPWKVRARAFGGIKRRGIGRLALRIRDSSHVGEDVTSWGRVGGRWKNIRAGQFRNENKVSK
jgi:hypothetical protein